MIVSNILLYGGIYILFCGLIIAPEFSSPVWWILMIIGAVMIIISRICYRSAKEKKEAALQAHLDAIEKVNQALRAAEEAKRQARLEAEAAERQARIEAEAAERQARLEAEAAERQARLEVYREELRQKEEYERLERERFRGLLLSIPKYDITVNPSAAKQNINVSDFYLNYTSLRKNLNLSRVSSFVAIDTETTGLVPGKNKIVQISAIRFEEFIPSEIFTTYINPGCSIPLEATDIHGITDEMVSDAPHFECILDSLEEFIGASTLVGHNLQFDLKFLRKFGYDSFKLNRSYFDTLTLSRLYDDISSHRLYDVCKKHGIYYTAHDSSEDALASGLLFKKYLKMKIGEWYERQI